MTTKPASPIAPPAPSYVLPAPKRATPVIVVPPRVATAGDRGSDVARALGERFLAFAECQQQFLAELRTRLEALDVAITDASRAQLKGALREVTAVLDWCDSVQVDLQTESRRAAAGQEPSDLAALCREVAASLAGGGEIDVVGQGTSHWWGDAAALRDAIRHALTLVAERTSGIGGRRLEVGSTDGAPWVRIWSSGEPGDSLEVDSVRRFRLAVGRLGIRVVPDALGPGGAGLVLLLPSHEPGGLDSDASIDG